MTYAVRFKRRGSWVWRKLERVKGDLVTQELGVPFRVFILEDESRVEVPIDGTEFRFCSKRFLVIKQRMEQEAGQVLPVKS